LCRSNRFTLESKSIHATKPALYFPFAGSRTNGLTTVIPSNFFTAQLAAY
jgi:hypothetical protein